MSDYEFYNTTLYVDENGQIFEKDVKIDNVKGTWGKEITIVK